MSFLDKKDKFILKECVVNMFQENEYEKESFFKILIRGFEVLFGEENKE